MKNHTSICFAFLLSLALLATSCKPATGGDDSSDYTEVLTALGISTSAKDTPRMDTNNKALGDGYNPLSNKTRTVLFKDCDLYIAGAIPSFTATGKDYLADISNSGIGNKLAQDEILNWEGAFHHASVAADTDGDGTDEVVTAIFDTTSHRLALRLIKKGAGGIISYSEVRSVTDETNITDSHISGPDCISMANGDFDGDGKDEIAVIYYGILLIFEDEDASFASIAVKPLPLPSTAVKQFFSVAAADFDDDGCDEIVASWGDDSNIASYCVFEDIKHSPSLTAINATGASGTLYATGVTPFTLGSQAIALKAATVKTGDVNGDRIPDAVFAGQNGNNGNYLFLLILAGRMNSQSEPYFEFLPTSAYQANYSMAEGPLAVGDMDGDNKADIAFYDSVYTISGGSIGYLGSTGDGSLDQAHGPAFWDGLCFGNIDNDVAQELVEVNYNRDRIIIWDYTGGSLSHVEQTVTRQMSGTQAISLCLPSIGSRAAVLLYEGHEVQFTQPKIIALLAAPPFYASLGGSSNPEAIQPSLGNACTVFGKSTGSGNSSDSTNGFSFSVSAGFHFETPFWGSGASAEVKATVESSFDWTSSQSSEVTYSYAFTNYTDDDLVVYSVVPLDCYYYKVLNAQNDAAVKSSYMISLPRAPVTTSMDLASYNALNGDCYDVDRTHLSHVIGVPSSYPTYTDMEALKAAESTKHGFYDITGLLLGTGTATQESAAESLASAASTFGYSVKAGLEFETVTGGLLLGGSLAYTHSGSYTATTSQGTRVSGTLASISTAYAKSADRFKWGIMAYPVADQANEQAYTVVTYWVTMNN
jgi:hypothetical protein